MHDIGIRQNPATTLHRRRIVEMGDHGPVVAEQRIDLGIVLRVVRPDALFADCELRLNIGES